MGVKDLWTVLEPVGEPCTMADLRGKVLAVDISGWIFQSLQSPIVHKKPMLRPHVRNLFWRLYHLMRNEVRIIVVFDGPSPKLKSVALKKRAAARRQQREKNMPEEEPPLDNIPLLPKAFRPMNVGGETYFMQYCNECKELLRTLRIPYIVSSGDAESTCAFLNRVGLVDGCLTDDNDAFLFGAKVVYRHYTCDKKRLENMKCFRSADIEEQLGLTQDHLIAMALILGCDYGLAGLKGIGKERALEVLQSWQGVDPLQKMRDWRHDRSLDVLSKFDPAVKPEHCKYCGHVGNTSDHRSDGCNGCARLGRACARVPCEEWECNCEWHKQHALFKRRQTEIKIRKTAMDDINFPDKEIIEIYKQEDPEEDPGTFLWTRPSFGETAASVLRLFGWNKEKAREKLITYFTAYDLMALKHNMRSYEQSSQPERVLSKRVENGRDMFEVQWNSIPDIPRLDDDANDVIVTRELKDLFTEVFPEYVSQFEGEKMAAKKSKKRPVKSDDCEGEDGSSPSKRKRIRKKDCKNNDSDLEHVSEEQKTAATPQKTTKRGRKPKISDGNDVKDQKCQRIRWLGPASDNDDDDDGDINLHDSVAAADEQLAGCNDCNEKEPEAGSSGASRIGNVMCQKVNAEDRQYVADNELCTTPTNGNALVNYKEVCKTPRKRRGRKRTAANDDDDEATEDEGYQTKRRGPRQNKIQQTPNAYSQQLNVECFFLPARRALNFDDIGTNVAVTDQKSAAVNRDSNSPDLPICVSDDSQPSINDKCSAVDDVDVMPKERGHQHAVNYGVDRTDVE